MNRRAFSIVKSLCDGESLTLATLAERLGVSTRTIRKDLDSISQAMHERGLSGITLGRGGRVICMDSPLLLLEDGEELSPASFHLEPDDRTQIAAALAACTDTPITLETIADSLMVSRGTIIHDLDDIKRIISAHRLEPVSQSGRGLHAEGREYDRRRLVLHAYRGLSPSAKRFFEEDLGLLYPDADMIEKIMLEQQYAHKQVLTDNCAADTLAYVRISLARVVAGHAIPEGEGPKPPATSHRLPLASDIDTLLAQYLHLVPLDSERDALCYRLRHQQFAHRSDESADIVQIQLLTRKFITRLSNKLGINLTDDFAFFQNLAAHLSSVLQPVPLDYPATDIVAEVMADNKAIVEAVRATSDIIAEHVEREVSDVEIGFIVLHVCAAIERKKTNMPPLRVVVACNAGIGTSQLLTVRLQACFTISVVKTCTIREASALEAGAADLIVATAPLRSPKIDWVLTSPLLTDAEVSRIGEKLASIREQREVTSRLNTLDTPGHGASELISRITPVIFEAAPDQAPELMRSVAHIVSNFFQESKGEAEPSLEPAAFELLPPAHIHLDVKCADWRKAVRKSAEVLLEDGYIEERYIDAILANIEENGPYVVLTPGFAMPHEGIGKGTIACGLSMIRLAEPVPFGEPELDPVEFVCCLSAVDHSSHLHAFFDLVNLMRRADVRELLHTAKTPEEFSATLERLELELGES